MAYGMLTSFALGAAQGLGTAMINKYSKDQDAEIKAKADAEREARIEEAAIRSEGRAATREESIYERNQADKYIERAEERQAKSDEEERKQRMLNDPTTLQGQKTVAEINTTTKQGLLAQSNITEKETKAKQDELLLSMQQELANETDTTKRSEIATKIGQMSGKTGDENKTLSKVVTPDGKSFFEITGVLNTRTGQEKWAENTTPINPKEVEAKAIAYANLKAGTNLKNLGEAETLSSKGWGDTEANNAKTAQSFTNAYNEFKVNGGKIVVQDKPNYSPAPFKADDPAKQKEYDIIFGGVVKQHESGSKGVNAKNPTSTAGGTYQLLNDTAIGYGATRDRAGVVSNAEKDKVAPKFYADVYKSTNGDPAAMIAAGFGQNDIKSAIKDAEKNGTKWWQEIDSSGVKKNMDEVYIRARESVARLEAAGINPDTRLLDFVDNYKATKIASTAPDKTGFTLRAVRPAL
jgi:hypothetical protein